MYRVIRIGEDFDPIVVISPADAKVGSEDAKYYCYASWQIGEGKPPHQFNEITSREAELYFSGMGGGIGWEEVPDKPFESLDEVLKYIQCTSQ